MDLDAIEYTYKRLKETDNPITAEDIWLPIPAFEGFYEVSNTGKVRGLKRGKELKQCKRTPGLEYRAVDLSRDNISKTHNVHRLVALAFLPNPLNKPTVNHKDSSPANNHVSNLEWATWSEQEIHARRTNGKRSWNYGLPSSQEAWNKGLTYQIKTHCKRGHEYTATWGGFRRCRTCDKLTKQRAKQRKVQ